MTRILHIAIVMTFLASGVLSHAQLIDYAKLDTARVYSSLEEALVNPSLVFRLDLSKKKLKEFPQEVFMLINLNELRLDKNKITEIPSQITGLRHLQRLSISRNRIENFIPEVCRLTNLVILDLSDNYLGEIPDGIRRLQSLKELILWSNMIHYFPTELGQLEFLERLDLLHNEMNVHEQDRLKNLLPNTYIHFSEPCNCFFDDVDEAGE